MMGWILGGLLGLAVGMIAGRKIASAEFKSAVDDITKSFDDTTDEIAKRKDEMTGRVVKMFESKISEYQQRELLYIGYLCSNGHKEVAARISESRINISVDDQSQTAGAKQ